MSTKNELRDQVLAEMNARRIDHKTYINSEWLLSEYETTLRKEQEEAYTKGYNAGLADGTGKPLLAIVQIREEAVAEAYEKEQMVSRLSVHKERLDLWDDGFTEGRRRERLGILNVLDGLKEVYTADAKTEDGETYALKGEEKEHSDSERNETIDEVIEALTPQNTKTECDYCEGLGYRTVSVENEYGLGSIEQEECSKCRGSGTTVPNPKEE